MQFYLFQGAVGDTDIRVQPVGHGQVEEVPEILEVCEVVEGVSWGLHAPVNIKLPRVSPLGQVFQSQGSLVKQYCSKFVHTVHTLVIN